ncbi:hypothetical protein [Streptomyces goshikiensis]|uniref:hypothetical protein n=1 Tax=Streptomyces goshikiensis TaxID=1942 RepID=UPI0036C06AAD
MPELTDTAAAAGAGDPGPWLARKFAGHAGVAADCRYPGCREARETPAPGRPGPPPEFCPAHNNRRDKQVAYRQEKKAEDAAARRAAEAAGTPSPATPEPLPVVLARRAREQSVLAELLPRVAHALTAVLAGEQAAADADAVAAHLAAAEQAATVRVEEADTARAAADRAAATAHTAAAEAVQERDAALREAAAALREAAEADQQAAAAGTAHAALNQRHADLTERAGRLDGELTALRPRLETQTGRITALEGDLLTTTTAFGAVRERAEGLQRQLDALDRDQKTERARHARELAELRAGHERALAGLRADITRLTAQNAALTAPPSAATDAPETGQPLQEGVPEGQLGMFTLGPADPPGTPAKPRAQEQPPAPVSSATPGAADESGEAGEAGELPVAIEDLGLHAGSGWCMARYPLTGDTWSILRDGRPVGTVTPERAVTGRRSLLGWSAREQSMTVRPTKGRRFNNRDVAARAVIRESVRRQPEPAAAAPAWWAALTERTATALARAAVPLATASADRGGHLSLFALAHRHAALRLAARAPREGDLAQLQTISESVLDRSKDGARLVAALRAAAAAGATTTLATADGRAWTLEPDLDHRDALIVCADGHPVGTLAPTSAHQTGRWTATHRRRALKPAGRAFPDRDAALQAVIAAERDHLPLPAPDDPAWDRHQPGLRANLYSAARAARDLKGLVAQLEPIEYRRAVTNALVEARRSVTAPMEPEHLAVLLDAPREDLGPKKSSRADRLHQVLQQIRDDLLAPAPPG